MIRFRAFRNDDPPALAKFWDLLPARRDWATRVTTEELERLIFSKLYFDRDGLILAETPDKGLLGFAHAACGSNATLDGIDCRRGVVVLALADPASLGNEVDQSTLGTQLLGHAEQYLQRRGADEAVAFGAPDLNPFYVGLMGGSGITGIPRSEVHIHRIFEASGYVAASGYSVQQRRLTDFRPLVDRQTMLWRRQSRLEVVSDPEDANWWQACVYGTTQRTEYRLFHTNGSRLLASALLWDMEPIAASQQVRARGMISMHVAEPAADDGLTLFLISEMFKQLSSEQVGYVEYIVPTADTARRDICRRLGFVEVEQTVLLRKSLST